MSDTNDTFPQPAEGLDISEVPDGLVVYHAATDRVHYLNATASAVLTCCDGTRPVAELADVIGELWQLEAPPVDEVRALVSQLRTEGVLR